MTYMMEHCVMSIYLYCIYTYSINKELDHWRTWQDCSSSEVGRLIAVFFLWRPADGWGVEEGGAGASVAKPMMSHFNK